jgi:hypothetical protein
VVFATVRRAKDHVLFAREWEEYDDPFDFDAWLPMWRTAELAFPVTTRAMRQPI